MVEAAGIEPASALANSSRRHLPKHSASQSGPNEFELSIWLRCAIRTAALANRDNRERQRSLSPELASLVWIRKIAIAKTPRNRVNFSIYV